MLMLLQDSNAMMRDEESCVHRALLKYLDAWSLSPDSWEFSFHVGRLLLLQGKSREALQHLQSGLALRPLHPALRSDNRGSVQKSSRAYIVLVKAHIKPVKENQIQDYDHIFILISLEKSSS